MRTLLLATVLMIAPVASYAMSPFENFLDQAKLLGFAQGCGLQPIRDGSADALARLAPRPISPSQKSFAIDAFHHGELDGQNQPENCLIFQHSPAMMSWVYKVVMGS